MFHPVTQPHVLLYLTALVAVLALLARSVIDLAERVFCIADGICDGVDLFIHNLQCGFEDEPMTGGGTSSARRVRALYHFVPPFHDRLGLSRQL